MSSKMTLGERMGQWSSRGMCSDFGRSCGVPGCCTGTCALFHLLRPVPDALCRFMPTNVFFKAGTLENQEQRHVPRQATKKSGLWAEFQVSGLRLDFVLAVSDNILRDRNIRMDKLHVGMSEVYRQGRHHRKSPPSDIYRPIDIWPRPR